MPFDHPPAETVPGEQFQVMSNYRIHFIDNPEPEPLSPRSRQLGPQWNADRLIETAEFSISRTISTRD